MHSRASTIEIIDTQENQLAQNKRTFLWLSLCRFGWLTGIVLFDFSLGIWTYQSTGSTMQFAAVLFFASAPGLCCGPFVGSLIDRCNRRNLLASAITMIMLVTAMVGLLYWVGRLSVGLVYLCVALISVCGAVSRPTALTLTSQLVPKEQLGRASGVTQLALSLAVIIAPPLASLLLPVVGFDGIVAVNMLLMLLALLTLSTLRFPKSVTAPATKASQEKITLSLVRQDLSHALQFLRTKPLLLQLLLYHFVVLTLTMTCFVLITPLVLTKYTTGVLSLVVLCEGIGAFLGSVVLIKLGTPKRLVRGLIVAFAVEGGLIFFMGASSVVLILCAMSFAIPLCEVLMEGVDQTLWLRKIPPEIQGRILALHEMTVNASVPLAALLGGALSDYVFEPLMQANGALAPFLGAWLGTTKGSGMSLMFVVFGALVCFAATLVLLHPKCQTLDSRLPDAH